ncbi:MAG: 50S ribosomal protein L6 [Gammaproteobacteria bacterium]|nr:50S ribosomal protein L6 [Gammaproteobacteria bacterium]MCY4226435.1 50S ribosomal protein L6 [Gammaproteobacteria bacterium]MCY4314360.1 50S ribosomal protein L6 [Gammaproteobacteria bacterium]
MSRIAKVPVSVPSGVSVDISNGQVVAKGPKGESGFKLFPGIAIRKNNADLTVEINAGDSEVDKQLRSMWGTTRALLDNLITGVSSGFSKRLLITGVGYRAQAQGRNLNLNLGYSHPVTYALPDGVEANTPSQTEIIVSGIDKQVVGQVAAEIRAFRPPEPYKGKGVRYADEYIVRKQAKKK